MTDADSGSPVVVGVDGSEHGLVAADLAAEEAARRRRPLEIVHAFSAPVTAGAITIPPGVPPMPAGDRVGDEAVRDHAEEMLHHAAARIRTSHPDLAIVTRLRDGFPAEVLTDASRQAALVVVGHRGVGGFAELLTGSVGIQLANHSVAPVIIVRGQVSADGPVVVGVDGSEGSRRAAEFAAETAALHLAAVVVLHAWPVGGWRPELAQAGEPPPAVPDEVAAVVADLSERHPQVPVLTEPRRGTEPAHAELVTASKNARLVVVGSRGRGGFRGLLLGSVSQALIHHAESPVAVVGPESQRP